MEKPKILLTGATGAVGSLLLPHLIDNGYAVSTFTRRPYTPPYSGVKNYRGNAINGDGLDAALAGVDVAYYLIHSMERCESNFMQAELQAAENFAAAAQRSGVKRTIYLGGLAPLDGSPSPHLASRLAVEQTLLKAVPNSVAFRTSIVVAEHSRSFRFLVRLVERLPVLALPTWQKNRTQPIDGRDVVEFLLAAAIKPNIGGLSFDITGPETVTYGELIQRITEKMLLRRPSIKIPFSVTPLASVIAAKIASEDSSLIEPLMESLKTDLTADNSLANKVFRIKLHSFNSAIEHALRLWEREEKLAAI